MATRRQAVDDPRAGGHIAAVVLGAVLLVVHPAASGGARGLARAHGPHERAAPARWALAEPMRADRDNGTATLLKDGRVLVTGGISPF